MDKTKKINEVLGISEEWTQATEDRLSVKVEENTYVTDVFLSEIADVRDSEFGKGINSSISTYEKKLMLAGYLLAQEMSARKLASLAQQAVLQTIMGKLSKEAE
jgi:hypothetical protein